MKLVGFVAFLLLLSCETNKASQRSINTQGFKSIKQLSLSRKYAKLIGIPMADGLSLFELKGSYELNSKAEDYTIYFKRDPRVFNESPFSFYFSEEFIELQDSSSLVDFRFENNGNFEFEVKRNSQRLFIKDRLSEGH